MTARLTATTCNRHCDTLAPHNSHLYFGSGARLRQYALRTERDGATVFMPDGTSIWRSAPGAVQALKFDVRLYLARLA